MIATLPMYDWPETAAANNALWSRMRGRLLAEGIEAPQALLRPVALPETWLSPELLIGQTCSYPLETVLAGKVAYVATPTYAVAGCETPGTYRSVIIKQGPGEDAPVPETAAAALPFWPDNATLALNGFDSMSGWHALQRDCAALDRAPPTRHVETGSHRASVIAVAQGRADMAAVDCVSFALARLHDPAAADVHVAGWTAERPGLPLITSLNTPPQAMAALRRAARAELAAIQLAQPTER
jgi:ABC-type phosphate/phosphonate transport system substrate-binding protein